VQEANRTGGNYTQNVTNETSTDFSDYKRYEMTKLSCPVSGGACIECGLYRGRHIHCSFFKKNIEIDLSQDEIARRRRAMEDHLTLEGVWDIRKTPKKAS
jgi:hypothetical protein